MKSTNKHEGVKQGLWERVAHNIGDKLEQIATNPRNCWNMVVYEPELSNEMIEDAIRFEA